jgi:hypothetical protein
MGNAKEATIIHRSNLSELRCAVCTAAPAFDGSSLVQSADVTKWQRTVSGEVPTV